MLKRIVFLMFSLALLIGMGVTANALAGDATGEMVYRWQGYNNFDQDSGSDDARGAGHLRSRVTFAGAVGENALYNLTVENYQIFGDPAPDANSIYTAAFTMKDFLFEDFDVTLGRIPVAYGRERIIGVEDWNLALNYLFEGVHGRYAFESGWLDYFNFKLIETFGGKYVNRGLDPSWAQGDTDVMGFYMHYDAGPSFFFEPYALVVTTENWADEDFDNDRSFTFGGLFDYVHEGIHFYGEVVAQSGTCYEPSTDKNIDEYDRSGLAYYAGLFYDFDSEVQPYIGFEYNYASGDDASTDDKDEAFDPLFGSTSDFLGIMDMRAWSDVTALRFAGGFSPADGLDVSADFFLFTLGEDNGGEDAIGNEIDVKLNYRLNDDVDLEGGLGMFSFDEATDPTAKAADRPSHMGYWVKPGDSLYFAWLGASLEF